ncbi:MAG: amino acid ABC transporter substrate-binding protein [Proteobacteria bacterium]|nr:amino acid ABC transporter substrate-binding protein [Pseudomonadota bacterium]
MSRTLRSALLTLLAFAAASAAHAQDKGAPAKAAPAATPPAAQAPAPAPADTLKRIRDTGIILIGVREASVPFSYLDASKQPQGYSVDLCLRVAEAIKAELKMPKLEVRFVPVTSADRIAMVKNGNVDLECGSTTNTRDRQNDVAFAYTTFVAGIKMLAKKSSNINSVDDLRGKTVVVTKGTTSEKMMNTLNNERLLHMTIKVSPDHDQSFKMVADGTAVAFPMDDVLLYGLISKSKNPDDYAVVGRYMSVEPYGIMMRKNDPAFERVVDHALNEMFQNGDARRIYAKWFATKDLTVPMNQYLREAFQTPNTYPAWP